MKNPNSQIPNAKSQSSCCRWLLGYSTCVLGALNGTRYSRSFRIWVLGFGIWVLGFALPSAQTLGDVAKREEVRRKQVKTPAKVYTNEDLRGDATPPTAPSSPQADSPASPAAPASAKDQPKQDDKGATDDPKKTEAYWKDRLSKSRSDLDRAKTFAEALQSRINALTTDFAARSDPAQRAQIGTDRQKAIAELDRVKKEIEADTKAIADIQEEARKAGVPAGWVR